MADNQSTLPTAEEWRDVPGWEGFYQVSDRGRVRSLDRTITRKDGHQARMRGKVLKGSPNNFGYPTVTLHSVSRGAVRVGIHRLVLEAFVGPCPAGAEACHWDDNPMNNSLSNLRWASHRENMGDRSRNWTECSKGHKITKGNIYVYPDGTRNCKTCKEEYAREWNRKNFVPKPPRPEKTHCKNGHPLKEPNLSQYRLAKGIKTCLACERARVHVRRNKHLKPRFKEVADSYYQEII